MNFNTVNGWYSIALRRLAAARETSGPRQSQPTLISRPIPATVGTSRVNACRIPEDNRHLHRVTYQFRHGGPSVPDQHQEIISTGISLPGTRQTEFLKPGTIIVIVRYIWLRASNSGSHHLLSAALLLGRCQLPPRQRFLAWTYIVLLNGLQLSYILRQTSRAALSALDADT